MFRCLSLLLVVMACVSCQRERVWIEPTKSTVADPNNIDESMGRLVLLAPAAMTLIADVYEGAPSGYAHQVMRWLKFGIGSMQFLYGPSLPHAADPVWNKGAYAGARGAHLMILLSLDKLEEVPGLNGPGGQATNVKATVTMRVLNALGEEIWIKTHAAEVEDKKSPKFRSGVGSAPGSAVWNANKKCISALKTWLDSKSDKEVFSKPAPKAPEPVVAAQIKVAITSEPLGADVLVNGVFKGNTPLEIYLPAKELTISIERSGYKTWSRSLKPSEGLEVKPVLDRNP